MPHLNRHSPDARGFEVRIAPLNGMGNGKSRHEGRMCPWRPKHNKRGLKQTDPVTGQSVLTFESNEELVLQALDTLRGVLDSLVKVCREMALTPQVSHAGQ